MKGEGISRTQLMALLWAGILAPAAALLPGLLLPQAGRNSALSVILASPLVLVGGWLLSRLGRGRGLAQGILDRLGPWAGRGIILLYIVWAQLLLSQCLWSCARRLLSSGNRDGSLWFFLIGVAVMLAWMGRGKLEAFARAGQLFLAALLIAAAVVLGLSLGQARPERLLPLDWAWGPTAVSALEAAGVLGWGLFAAFLLGAVRDQGERRGWHWLFWGLGGILLLAGAQAIMIGNLGVGLAMELDNPFFALAKSVGVEGAFQRVESIISALWTFADLAMGGILVFAVREMARVSLPARLEGWTPWLSVLLAAGGGLVLLSGNGVGQWLGEQVIPLGNLIFGLVLPGLLCLIRQRTGISCEQKEG